MVLITCLVYGQRLVITHWANSNPGWINHSAVTTNDTFFKAYMLLEFSVWNDVVYQAPKESRRSKGKTHSKPVGVSSVRLGACECRPGSNWHKYQNSIKTHSFQWKMMSIVLALAVSISVRRMNPCKPSGRRPEHRLCTLFINPVFHYSNTAF